MYTYLMYNICKKRPFIIWKCQIKREIVGVDISCFLIDLEVKCFVINILISCLLCIWFIWSNWNCFCCYTSVYSTLSLNHDQKKIPLFFILCSWNLSISLLIPQSVKFCSHKKLVMQVPTKLWQNEIYIQ